MKNCSYCGRENEDSATVCRECGTEFPVPEPVSEDEVRLKDPSESLITVAAFDDLAQANLLKSRLEGAGIEACIPEDLAPNLFAINKPLQEPFTVRVAAKDADAAKELLSET
jgi:cell division septation protein DedD